MRIKVWSNTPTVPSYKKNSWIGIYQNQNRWMLLAIQLKATKWTVNIGRVNDSQALPLIDWQEISNETDFYKIIDPWIPVLYSGTIRAHWQAMPSSKTLSLSFHNGFVPHAFFINIPALSRFSAVCCALAFMICSTIITTLTSIHWGN